MANNEIIACHQPCKTTVLSHFDFLSNDLIKCTHCQFIWSSTFETKHDKTNTIACALSEDSDQPVHPPIRCALNGKLRTQSFFMRTAKNLIRLGGCPGWSESLLGARVILLVLSCCGYLKGIIVDCLRILCKWPKRFAKRDRSLVWL